MINLSMTWWELALIIIAIAIVVGTYFLVRFLKDLIRTVDTVNSLLTENKRSLDDIITNVDVITKDATRMTDKADSIAGEMESTVSAVRADVLDPLIQTLATLVKIIQTITKRKSKEQNIE